MREQRVDSSARGSTMVEMCTRYNKHPGATGYCCGARSMQKESCCQHSSTPKSTVSKWKRQVLCHDLLMFWKCCSLWEEKKRIFKMPVLSIIFMTVSDIFMGMCYNLCTQFPAVTSYPHLPRTERFPRMWNPQS